MWGQLIRPWVEDLNDYLVIISSEDVIQAVVRGLYHVGSNYKYICTQSLQYIFQVFKYIPGAGTRIPAMDNEKLKDIFDKHKEKVGTAFARRYYLHD